MDQKVVYGFYPDTLNITESASEGSAPDMSNKSRQAHPYYLFQEAA